MHRGGGTLVRRLRPISPDFAGSARHIYNIYPAFTQKFYLTLITVPLAAASVIRSRAGFDNSLDSAP
jgi:hypothetical protein